jgi:hypothetical protein
MRLVVAVAPAICISAHREAKFEDIPLQPALRPLESNAGTIQAPGSMHSEADLLSRIGPITPVPGSEIDKFNTPTSTSALNQIIPHRTKTPDIALYLIKLKGLSRFHRRLFLLIDGVRDLAELANLLNRNQLDTLVLLYDLQRANCIIIPSSHESSE